MVGCVKGCAIMAYRLRVVAGPEEGCELLRWLEVVGKLDRLL